MSSFWNFAKLDRGHETWIVHPKTGRLAALLSPESVTKNSELIKSTFV